MKQTGVWSFRTQTGIARVINGRLRVRRTPRGLLTGVRHAGWQSWLQPLVIGGGFVSLLDPLRQLVQTVVAEQSLAAVLSVTGVLSLLFVVSLLGIMGASLLRTVGRPASIPVYDINRITVDETELTVTYEADNGEHETTLAARDEEALDEAVEILQLKGATVER